MNRHLKNVRIAVTCLIILLLGFFIDKKAYATNAVMKISPVATSVYIKAGNTQNYQFTIENVGEEAYKFKTYTAPYSVTNEDYDADITTETNYSQITRWISFQDDSGSFVKEPIFKLEPGEKKTIIYRISVPDDIPEGGQYCVIFAESINEKENNKDNVSVGIESRSRVSLIVLGHGDGDTNNIAEITDFSLTGFFTTKKIEGIVKVKNSGNTDFTAIYALNIKSIFGKTLYSTTDNFVVLPQTERRFQTAWSDTPICGVYRVSFKVTALDKTEEQKRLIFIMPSFMIVIMLLLLTSIVVWATMVIRKRKERSSRLVV